ncbi:MAG: NmrA family NAD(P)-binding protein [Candidatus Thiodiazotropha sp.]
MHSGKALRLLNNLLGVSYLKKVCIIGAPGKLGRYVVQHSLDRGYQVVAVCREQNVTKSSD